MGRRAAAEAAVKIEVSGTPGENGAIQSLLTN
jgi:hypothetical protein